MALNFSIERINKILEFQKSDFRITKKKSVCSVVVEDIENEKVKEMNNKLLSELKQI